VAVTWSVVAGAGGAYPVSVKGKGTAAQESGWARIAFAELTGTVAGQAVRLQAPTEIAWQDGGWRLAPADLAIAGGRVTLSGAASAGRVEAAGDIAGLPLGLAALADPRLRLSGRIDGKLRASGPADRPVIEATLTGRDIRPADGADAAVPGFTATLDVRQDGDAARARASLSGPNETRAEAAVETAPLLRLDPPALMMEDDRPLNGTLSADGRLDLIDTLVGLGDDRLAGRLVAEVKLAGTLGRPAIAGTVRLDGGAYEGAATGTVLRNINGEIRFSGDSATLAALSADDGGTGRLTGSGTARLTGDGVATDGMTVVFDRFAALRHPSADIVVSGPLTASGTLAAPRLAGKLTVDSGEIRIPERFAADVVELNVVEINGPKDDAAAKTDAAEPSLAQSLPVALDIAVAVPGRTFVRGRGLDSEWQGNLTVKGTSRTPVFGGKLAVVRGTFAFAGKTFVVKEGSVFFPEGGAVEPEIAARAEAQLSGLVARIDISGTVSKPAIGVSSEPALPQEDVLAHILFGRKAGELSALQAAQLAQSAATLSGKGGAGIVDKVRQAVGVDVLNVESGGGDGKGASLKAGKYLTDDVFLSVTQGTEPGSQKVGVEVQVTPNITLQSDVSGEADGNVGVNWKWDY